MLIINKRTVPIYFFVHQIAPSAPALFEGRVEPNEIAGVKLEYTPTQNHTIMAARLSVGVASTSNGFIPKSEESFEIPPDAVVTVTTDIWSSEMGGSNG